MSIARGKFHGVIAAHTATDGLINSTSNVRLRIRYLAVSHFLEGKSRTEIAQFLKVSRTSVNKWVKAYLDFGLEGLQEKAHTGRPHRLTKQQFEYAYLFGAVYTGDTEAIVSPFSNMEAMRKHLSLISDATPTGKHSVVIMDQASWHQSYLGQEYSNLSIIHIPTYSSELNPIEQVWSWL